MKNNFISSIWNFSEFKLNETNYVTHDFLRWYGKLTPPLVSKIINLYSEENEKILANFAGSGTVLVESNISNRNVIGIDSSPLSNLLCKVKTTPLSINFESFFNELKNQKSNSLYPMDEEDKKWFYKKQFNDMMFLKEKINEIKKESEKNFYLLGLASIINKISKVDARCINHIVVDKNKPKIDVFELFHRKIIDMSESIKEYATLEKPSSVSVYSGDARKLNAIKDESIDLIISHPPYLGCINYSNIYKLPNKILGHNYENVKLNDLSTTSLKIYMENMGLVFDEMKRVLKKGKHAAVIIGDNRVKGNIIPTFSYFIQYANTIGFELKDIFIWELTRKAGMNIKRWGNHIDHNYILIFRKS